MKITRQAKEATRIRILKAARELFVQRGFEETTTRELATRADIAAGTLFNYFPNKEALAAALLGTALTRGHERFDRKACGDESLAEALFLLVISELRQLEPYRGFVGVVLETALSPFAAPDSPTARGGHELRAAHLARVTELLAAKGGHGSQPNPITLHLYWTLYLGVLAFWSADPSPKQEDTLAVLDEALRVFTLALPDRTADQSHSS